MLHCTSSTNVLLISSQAVHLLLVYTEHFSVDAVKFTVRWCYLSLVFIRPPCLCQNLVCLRVLWGKYWLVDLEAFGPLILCEMGFTPLSLSATSSSSAPIRSSALLGDFRVLSGKTPRLRRVTAVLGLFCDTLTNVWNWTLQNDNDNNINNSEWVFESPEICNYLRLRERSRSG